MHGSPISPYIIKSSIVQPTVTVLMLDLFPATRGLASSLQGFGQFMLGGVVAGTLAPLLDTTLPGLAAGLAGFTALSFAAWTLYARRARGILAR